MNSFSIKRVYLLLHSELLIAGRKLLIYVLSAIAVVTLINSLPTLFDADFGLRSYSIVISGMAPSVLVIVGLAFFMRLHMLTHQSTSLPFVVIPSTTNERCLYILIMGIIYLAMAVFIIQLSIWIEVLMYPELLAILHGNVYSKYMIGNSLFINPINAFEGQNGAVFFVVMLLLFISIKFRRNSVVYPLYFLAPLFVIFIVANAVEYYYEAINSDYDLSPTEFTQMFSNALGVIGVLFMILSYFSIKRLQQKR